MSRPPQWCRSCDTRIVFAARPGTDQKVPYEAQDRTAFSPEAAGCDVIVAGQAWLPQDLIQDFRVRFETSEDKARDLVAGYPFHRAHTHDETTDPVTTGVTGAGVRAVIESRKYRYTDELALQVGLAEAFEAAGLNARREVRLDDQSRIDFLIDRVGVEITVAGTVEAVERKLTRCASHVDELVLVTTRPVHRYLPDEINDTPLLVVLIRGSAHDISKDRS
jgi:hypothetical protein